eukprot:1875983-Pyramimonas_sp.AAC.2
MPLLSRRAQRSGGPRRARTKGHSGEGSLLRVVEQKSSQRSADTPGRARDQHAQNRSAGAVAEDGRAMMTQGAQR